VLAGSGTLVMRLYAYHPILYFLLIKDFCIGVVDLFFNSLKEIIEAQKFKSLKILYKIY